MSLVNGSIMQDNINYWNNRAKSYSLVNQSELLGIQHNNWLQQIMKSIDLQYPYVEKEKIKILDVGTGPGFIAIILRKAGYQVTAVDCTENMLNEAKVNSSKWQVRDIDFKLMNAEELLFPSEEFHVVISRNLTWVLENPEQAYSSWYRVLKAQGILLNFDANWYGYLYDDEKYKDYQNDRKKVSELGYDDHYLDTDIIKMEKIAKSVPLSRAIRPAWDINILKKLAYKSIKVEIDFGSVVWSDEERANYHATPMFKIEMIKGDA